MTNARSLLYRCYKGQQATFSISVRTPENYPVDLYMLMDMSYSMRDNLEAVRGLGKDLGR